MSTKKKFSFKEAIAEIRKVVFTTTAGAGDAGSTDNLKDYSTDAGASIKIDKLEVGGKVFEQDGTTAIVKSFKLVDGTAVDVDNTGVITAVTVPDDGSGTNDQGLTPDQVAMNNLAAKFATGTPEERITNLETMCKAMMDYCYGWRIEEAEDKAAIDQAIEAYKTIATPEQFTAAFNEKLQAQKTAFEASLSKQQTAFEKVLELLEKFADEPDGDPVDGNIQAKESKKDRAARLVAESVKFRQS